MPTKLFWQSDCLSSNLAILYGLCILDSNFLYWPVLCRGGVGAGVKQFIISIAYFNFQFSSPEPIAHWWAYRIGRPSSVRRPHSLNIFSSETSRPISQISYGASLGWGNESLFKWYWSHDQDGRHADILVKSLKNLLLQNQRPMILKLGMQHRVLEYYQVCSNDDPGLTLTYLTARSNLVPYAFVWEKVKQWIFQKLLLCMIWN